MMDVRNTEHLRSLFQKKKRAVVNEEELFFLNQCHAVFPDLPRNNSVGTGEIQREEWKTRRGSMCIFDECGVGKDVEAGWIREVGMRARGRLRGSRCAQVNARSSSRRIFCRDSSLQFEGIQFSCFYTVENSPEEFCLRFKVNYILSRPRCFP